MMTNVGPAHPLGIRESRARTFAIAILIAVIAHLPFTPLPFVLRALATYLTRGDTSWDAEDDDVIIPISLFDDTSHPDEPPPPSEPQATPEGEAKPPKRDPDVARKDAGPPQVLDAGLDDGAPRIADAAREKKTPGDAGSVVPLDAHGDGGGPSLKDSLSLVGALARAVQGKPNYVVLDVWFSTIRDHALGPLVGGMLSCNPQWRDFMGDLVDPLRDLDGVMVAGPALSDSSKLRIFAHHRMEDAKVNEMIATLGARAKKKGEGGLIPTGHEEIIAARFHADRADRIAFTHPTKMIVVAAPEEFEQLKERKEPLNFPAGQGKAMSATIANPWRPARRVGLRLPESLSEVRIQISAGNDGGVNVEIEFDDQDASLAKAHASEISEQVRSLVGIFVSDLDFVAHDNHVDGQTHLSRFVSALLLGYFRSMICPAGFDGGAGFR